MLGELTRLTRLSDGQQTICTTALFVGIWRFVPRHGRDGRSGLLLATWRLVTPYHRHTSRTSGPHIRFQRHKPLWAGPHIWSAHAARVSLAADETKALHCNAFCGPHVRPGCAARMSLALQTHFIHTPLAKNCLFRRWLCLPYLFHFLSSVIFLSKHARRSSCFKLALLVHDVSLKANYPLPPRIVNRILQRRGIIFHSPLRLTSAALWSISSSTESRHVCGRPCCCWLGASGSVCSARWSAWSGSRKQI